MAGVIPKNCDKIRLKEYPKRSLSPRGREESPDSTGQGAGEIPVGANPRKVPQKHTAQGFDWAKGCGCLP